ncbi:MAG: SDR family oxidoreductase [Bifidobacteriaceae bacterium]|jgi:NAD(P)-dependent dehydrogenase (short-subunit alcohol dehydrogenase family)|nr:SDR family oxidoreductase [Bifidobacteriaceae bacterium]
MAERFEGKVVLIIGAATGIGKAAALAFAKEGAKLVLSAHRTPPDVVDEINAAGGVASAVKMDVGDEESVKNAIAQVVERHGRLDVALNNAGSLPVTKPLAEFTAEEFNHTLRVDLIGTFLAMKYEIQQMLLNGGGSIINTGSVVSVVADPGMAPYVAAKHGVLGLTRGAALEYAEQGIRVNCLSPGLVETPMTARWLADPAFRAIVTGQNAVHRTGRPEEIAGMILYLASDDASFTTGGVYLVDGGQTAH